ncbi:hypothetical protein GCM10027275_47470 [Rhabdobacter roseus]
MLLILATACSPNDAAPDGAPQKGYATGRVTDTNGKPMPGVKVVIDNTMFYNSYAVGTTNEQGFYKIQLPPTGTFLATATLTRTYNGKQYTLDLHPDKYEEFSIDGAVTNFEWKLSGRRHLDSQGYYGATISVNKDVMSQIYDSENIEFTLVPVGKLIDGSDGKTLKLRHGQPHTNDYGNLVDIPLGRYTMTAEYVRGGVRHPLMLVKHFSNDNYQSTLQVDFEPDNIWGPNSAFIRYLE